MGVLKGKEKVQHVICDDDDDAEVHNTMRLREGRTKIGHTINGSREMMYRNIRSGSLKNLQYCDA